MFYYLSDDKKKTLKKKILLNRPKKLFKCRNRFQIFITTYILLLLHIWIKTNTKYCKEPPRKKKKENTPCIIKITADRGRQRFKKKTIYICLITLKVVIHDITKNKIHICNLLLRNAMNVTEIIEEWWCNFNRHQLLDTITKKYIFHSTWLDWFCVYMLIYLLNPVFFSFQLGSIVYEGWWGLTNNCDPTLS